MNIYNKKSKISYVINHIITIKTLGGYLGTQRRWRALKPTKSFVELETSNESKIPDIGQPLKLFDKFIIEKEITWWIETS